MRRISLAVAAIALTLVLAACDPTPTGSVTAGMCPPPAQHCDDTSRDPVGGSSEPADAYLVGLARDELPDDVRIARIGDEWFALTEDYVIGRRTVELDVDDDGITRVVLVAVEADHGLVTFPQ